MIETNKIESRDNARLKLARRVRDGREPDQIFVEGARLCEEAIRSGLTIHEGFVSERFLATEHAAGVLDRIGVSVHLLSDKLFGSISATTNSQGIALIGARPRSDAAGFESAIGRKKESIPVVIFLEEVNNPANLGAILRVAEASGSLGVVVSKNSADPFSVKALRAAMGSAFRVPVWTDVEPEDAFSWAVVRNMRVAATAVDGQDVYSEIDWKIPRLLVFGPEAHGLSGIAISNVDEAIRIPMNSAVESLNLAVSAGVILFEARRQILNANDSRL